VTEFASDVLDFWFRELREEQLFKVDPGLDELIRRRFGALHADIARALPEAAGADPGVIVLDQFPRNMFRGTPRAFATDAAALALATIAVDRGIDAALPPVERRFLYLPFEHSEDPNVQARSVALFATLGLAEALDYAIRHKVIIDRFGRYPHRNAILGRVSSAEEIAFLATPGSSF
jgi:uncharacterized protein (DUF924 family)